MIFPSGQESALHLGLRDYLLFAPRNSLISANKEGICYYMVEPFGTSLFFQCRWDMETRRRCFEENGKKSALMICYDVITEFVFEANLSYILWDTAFNTSFLLLYLGFDMRILSMGDSGKITQHHQKADAPPPVTQIQNSPLLLCLIVQHSFAILLLVSSLGLHC